MMIDTKSSYALLNSVVISSPVENHDRHAPLRFKKLQFNDTAKLLDMHRRVNENPHKL